MAELNYEYLIRKIYNSPKTSVNGADAKYYKYMAKAHYEIQSQLQYPIENQYFLERFRTVRMFVLSALNYLIENNFFQLEMGDRHIVKLYVNQLDVEFHDKETIDRMLISLIDILNKYNAD